MKKITLLSILLCSSLLSNAQVGIGNTDPKAQLDISAGNSPSEKDGILIPRLAEFPTGVTADQDGMLVFMTGGGTPYKGFYYYDNNTSNWAPLTSAAGGTLDDAYDFGGLGNGKTITATDGAVSINGEDGLLVEGGFGSGTPISIGSERSVMFFSPIKSAFRAGYSSDSALIPWLDANTGLYSAAFNNGTLAAGENSFAIGLESGAYGDNSFAGGNQTNAHGDNSFAFGAINYANGDGSVALGVSNVASGYTSIVMGNNSQALGTSSFACGTLTSSSGDYSTAFGFDTIALGDNSLSFGIYSQSNGNYSFSGGYGGIAEGAASFAYNGTATGTNSISFNGTAQGNNSMAVSGGITSGEQSFAIGLGATASGINSRSFGYQSEASGENSASFGYNTEASSYNETVFGSFSNIYTAVSSTSFNSSDQVFSIGNGTNVLARSNALTIYKSGLMNINDEYNMPLTDGTSGQIMTTDGSGNVTFQNPDGVGTDNQNLLAPTLTGTTLNLGIEDGSGSSVNLAGLQDGTGTDDQNLLTPTLTGTTLNLNIEDGTGTSVNLAALQDGTGTDNQNLLTATLKGTTLNLNIEDGTGTSVNLVALQDGTGTDNQTIDTFNFNSSTNILTLEIEDDGVTARTVNLSALDSGGDITSITAGDGLNGGGNTGAVTINASANNGLTVDAAQDRIQLGGALTEDTEITFGTRDVRWNLNNSGDFIIQDNGVNKWEVNSNGDEVIGGGTYWRQDHTAGALTATLTSTANVGTLNLRNNGATRTSLTGNGDSFFNGGKVGIGETNPDGFLEILANNTGTAPHINLIDNGGSGARINFKNTTTTNANVWTLYGQTNNTAANSVFNLFHQTTGNIITAKGDGLVGINGDPDMDFHVYHKQGTNAHGFRLENSATNNAWRYYISSATGDLILFSRIGLGAESIRGSFDSATGAYTTASDRRLKKDFKSLHFDWKTFMNLEAMSYRFISQSKNDKKSIGFIAQDINKVYPELIAHDEETDMFTMNYSGLGVIAIKAVQELKIKVDQLALENSKLKAQLLKYEDLETLLAKRSEI